LIATPVVYSLLDDLRSTARWRAAAQTAGGTWHSVVERFKRPRRRPAPEAPAEQTPDAAGD
jgi:hypothetical protein